MRLNCALTVSGAPFTVTVCAGPVATLIDRSRSAVRAKVPSAVSSGASTRGRWSGIGCPSLPARRGDLSALPGCRGPSPGGHGGRGAAPTSTRQRQGARCLHGHRAPWSSGSGGGGGLVQLRQLSFGELVAKLAGQQAVVAGHHRAPVVALLDVGLHQLADQG